MSCMILHYLQQ